MLKQYRGVTVLELIITFGVVCILGALAWPAYKNFERRTFYSDILTVVEPYKDSVKACYEDLHAIAKCDGGFNHIGPNILVPKGPIASLNVTDGVITVVPVAKHGVKTTDTYILTPEVDGKTVKWKTSGDAVKNNYVE